MILTWSGKQKGYITLVWLESTKMVVLVSPTPAAMGAARTASRNGLEAVSSSSLSVTPEVDQCYNVDTPCHPPVSANCLTPSDTEEPMLNRGDATE